jgi:nitrate/nitrite transporter NarK
MLTTFFSFQSMYNSILYGWTPEIFPAPIRGTACGLASFWGRLFGIVAPLIAQYIYAIPSINGVLYLAGATALVSTLAILAIPTNLIGKQSF